jgi:hypothetical protein
MCLFTVLLTFGLTLLVLGLISNANSKECTVISSYISTAGCGGICFVPIWNIISDDKTKSNTIIGGEYFDQAAAQEELSKYQVIGISVEILFLNFFFYFQIGETYGCYESEHFSWKTSSVTMYPYVLIAAFFILGCAVLSVLPVVIRFPVLCCVSRREKKVAAQAREWELNPPSIFIELGAKTTMPSRE